MRRLPVLAVIREAHAFTFTNLGAIIGLIWLPMVIATVGDFFITQHFSQQTQQVMAGNPEAAAPAVLIQVGFFLVRLLLYAMMYVPVAQLALGQRQGGAMVHFTFGMLEWRMFRVLLGVMLLFMLAVLALSLMAAPGAAAVMKPLGLLAEVAALLFLFGMIYIGVRMVFLVPAIVVADEALLLRALELYEVDRLDFAEAYLVASAEVSGVGKIASFDRSIDRVTTVQRIEP